MSGEVKEDITGIKLGIMACVLLAGCNVFFPYLSCLKDSGGPTAEG